MQNIADLSLKLPKCDSLENGVPCYLLVDGAQQSNLYRNLERHGCTLMSLLNGAQLDAIPIGPYLTRLPAILSTSLEALLIQQLHPRTHVSFITSTIAPELLTQHLTWLTDVKHTDGSEWVNRYFDVRILPLWFNILSEEQRQQALAPIAEWAYLTPEYEWKIIQGGTLNTLPDTSKPMCQTEKQNADLLEACVPHMVLAQIQENNPLALSHISVQQRYAYISEQFATAKQYGVSDMNDLKTYTLISLEYGPQMHQAPPLQAILKSAKASEFTRAISQLTPDDWEVTRKTAAQFANRI